VVDTLVFWLVLDTVVALVAHTLVPGLAVVDKYELEGAQHK